MRFRRLSELFLAVILIAGLAVAPWAATPAVAMHGHAAAMADMSDMTADMPCCPDKQKAADCDNCPLLGLCALKATQADRSAAAILIRAPIHLVLVAANDVLREGPDHPPPDHPPRTLV